MTEKKMCMRFSDLQIAKISLFVAAMMGAVLTIILPGSLKLVFLIFLLMCTILGLSLEVVPLVKLISELARDKVRNYR